MMKCPTCGKDMIKGAVISSSLTGMMDLALLLLKTRRRHMSANPVDMYLPIIRSDDHCRLHPAGQALSVFWRLTL